MKLTDKQRKNLLSHADDMDACGWKDDAKNLRALLAVHPVADAAVAPNDARYIVVGYGETDHPQAAFINDRGELLDAVLGMIYTTAADADESTRLDFGADLYDDDNWSNDGIWRTNFEIGGVIIYDLGESVRRAPTPTVAADAVAPGMAESREGDEHSPLAALPRPSTRSARSRRASTPSSTVPSSHRQSWDTNRRR